jgi:hypothetical protein
VISHGARPRFGPLSIKKGSKNAHSSKRRSGAPAAAHVTSFFELRKHFGGTAERDFARGLSPMLLTPVSSVFSQEGSIPHDMPARGRHLAAAPVVRPA